MAPIKSLKLRLSGLRVEDWKATFFARQHEVEAFAAAYR
jgi:hypothetical protein